MNSDLHLARETLKHGQYTCVLCRGELIYTSRHRGVRPLLELLECAQSFAGFSAADKVVGKATAFLYVLLGVQAVYTQVVSTPAMAVLERHGISLEYAARVEAISNRDKTGFCPMESAVRNIEDPEQALAAVRETLRKLQQG